MWTKAREQVDKIAIWEYEIRVITDKTMEFNALSRGHLLLQGRRDMARAVPGRIAQFHIAQLSMEYRPGVCAFLSLPLLAAG